MRFCPFCSAENVDEAAVCASCGRRLPPLPPRRAGSKGQPTGVVLPPRATSPTTPPPVPRAKGSTMPPPLPSGTPTPQRTSPQSGSTDYDTAEATLIDPAHLRDSAPSLPPPPRGADDTWAGDDSAAAQLRNAISPGPAAERRPLPPPEPRVGGEPARRKSDSKAPPLPVNAFARASSSGGIPSSAINAGSGSRPALDTLDRSNTPSASPLDRARSPGPPPRPHTPSQPPPPLPERAKSPSRPPPPSPYPSPPPGSEYAVQVASNRLRSPTGIEPPPTRIQRTDALADRPFTPQKVAAVPEIPEPGLLNAARYAYQFALARWQRRGAIKTLGIEIKQDTEALDQVLGALGRTAREARIEGRVFSAENAAITAAEERVASLQKESGDVDGRKAEENSRFVDVERERNEKLVDAERMVEEAQREMQQLEAQRRSLRDKRKELDRRQKAYLKNADDHDRQAGSAPLGDQRQELRRAAEGHRKEAAALEPDKQEIDRRITALERPISETMVRLDAAKAELDAAKRSLADAREGHTHRLAELDAEQKRKAREVGLAEAEIQRRLVTLGTLVNLNRIEDLQFAELYQRIDRIRGAITARTTEIEKLTAEREAYDRGTLVRGVATIGGAFVLLIALIVILRAVL